MSLTSESPGFRLNGWHVLAMFVLFFGVDIAVNTGFVIMSVKTFPGEVSVTPYEDGLLHDRAVAQFQAQERLGWRASAAAEPGSVAVQLRDRSGAPLSGLVVTGKLERPATEAGRIVLAFHETRPGRYLAHTGELAGAWDLTAVATDRSAHRFEAQRRLAWR